MARAPLFGRRQLLTGTALAAAGLLHGLPARADLQLDPGALTWRRRLADAYLDDTSTLDIRALQDGLEVWEAADGGYMVVDEARKCIVEASPTARSPFEGVQGDLAYLGPGQYVVSDSSQAVDLMTGDRAPAREMRAIARDAIHETQDGLVISPWDAEVVAVTPNSAPGITPVKTSPTLPRLKSGDAKSRVPNYGYVTGFFVYKNTDGNCGWIAGSIVTRYWHARSSARKLLPTAYRNGTNLTQKPNFADYLQGTGGDSTWAPNVEERLAWNAKKQKVSFVSSWSLTTIGMWAEINAGYPSIVFGNLPTGDKKKGPHAVVAYGRTHGGYPITHYGWAGYTDVILNDGVIGSNSRFRLS